MSYGTNEIEIASTESELFDSSQMLELDTSFDIADSHDNLTGLGEVTVGDSVSGGKLIVEVTLNKRKQL